MGARFLSICAFVAMADVCRMGEVESVKKSLKMVADLESIVALPSRRMERATVISETSLESVEEEGNAEGEESNEVFEDEERLVAYGDGLEYPTILFKTNPFAVEGARDRVRQYRVRLKIVSLVA